MYYIVYGFLWLVSLLPLKVLFVLSDALYGLVYYILRYRREIVMNNLLLAFPEKTEKERKKIAKKFYHNLIDSFVETIKMLSASRKFILTRMKGNWELVNDLKQSGKSIQLHLGHNFNWEWASAGGAMLLKPPYLLVYMPLASKIFDRIFLRIRSKFGEITLLRATHMSRDFIPHRKKQYILCLVADQNPGHPANAWWFNFFGRPTPFIKGPSRTAVNNNSEVVFSFIHKVRRGYYEVVFSHVKQEISDAPDIELARKFVIYLEGVIRQYPEMWLWSHRRWKWEWKPEYGNVIE